VCALLTRVGYAPVRDLCRLEPHRDPGDILGGAAGGVCNILCLTGDGVANGDHPQAKPVFDLDCRRCARPRPHAAHEHRPSGRGGDVCAARFPRRGGRFAPPFDWRPFRLAKKVDAGAQFVQTQYWLRHPAVKASWNVPAIKACRARASSIGVGPLRLAKAAE
jgi:methylenetetrahydrofolate reductase (NADPH)